MPLAAAGASVGAEMAGRRASANTSSRASSAAETPVGRASKRPAETYARGEKASDDEEGLPPDDEHDRGDDGGRESSDGSGVESDDEQGPGSSVRADPRGASPGSLSGSRGGAGARWDADDRCAVGGRG